MGKGGAEGSSGKIGMGMLDNQGWLQDASEWVSDAIPNEFSKTSNNWTGNIPYIGWILRGLAGADNFSESYANSGDFMGSAMHGWKGFSGNAADPDMNSPKNQAGMFGSGDWALNIGQGMGIASMATGKGMNFGGGGGDVGASGDLPANAGITFGEGASSGGAGWSEVLGGGNYSNGGIISSGGGSDDWMGALSGVMGLMGSSHGNSQKGTTNNSGGYGNTLDQISKLIEMKDMAGGLLGNSEENPNPSILMPPPVNNDIKERMPIMPQQMGVVNPAILKETKERLAQRYVPGRF